MLTDCYTVCSKGVRSRLLTVLRQITAELKGAVDETGER